MIRIKRPRDEHRIHRHFRGEELIDRVKLLIEARIAKGDDIDFEGALGDWKKVKDLLKADSYDKCAYCEASTAVVAHGDVEHFRPKSIYWWLALCLDNYVYSCQLCNQTYKSDEFPISGTVLTAPSLTKKNSGTDGARRRLAARLCPDPTAVDETQLIALWLSEEPHLPHPYLEDPEPLFAWSVVETAEEVWLSEPDGASLRARNAVKAAIEYLGLNREQLLRARYFFYRQLLFVLLAWRTASRSLKSEAIVEIERMCRNDYPFAGMCRYFARKAGFPLRIVAAQ